MDATCLIMLLLSKFERRSAGNIANCDTRPKMWSQGNFKIDQHVGATSYEIGWAQSNAAFALEAELGRMPCF
jgi:hypothetical protein